MMAGVIAVAVVVACVALWAVILHAGRCPTCGRRKHVGMCRTYRGMLR